MTQHSSHSVPLGTQLYLWRTHARWSRRELAQIAGIALSTAQDLEHGHGSLSYYVLALDALGLRLRTPGHGHRKLGTALMHEPIAQNISRRELARHLDVSPNTLASLEHNQSTQFSKIEAYARAIGVKLVVGPRR